MLRASAGVKWGAAPTQPELPPPGKFPGDAGVLVPGPEPSPPHPLVQPPVRP